MIKTLLWYWLFTSCVSHAPTQFLLMCWYWKGRTVTFIILRGLLAFDILVVLCHAPVRGRDGAVVRARPPRLTRPRGLRLQDLRSTDSSRTKRARTGTRQAVHTHNYEVYLPLHYSAALSVLNATLVPSSNCISRRRQQEVSRVYWCSFITRFLSFKLWKVTSLQTEGIWRCHAVVLLIHQAIT